MSRSQFSMIGLNLAVAIMAMGLGLATQSGPHLVSALLSLAALGVPAVLTTWLFGPPRAREIIRSWFLRLVRWLICLMVLLLGTVIVGMIVRQIPGALVAIPDRLSAMAVALVLLVLATLTILTTLFQGKSRAISVAMLLFGGTFFFLAFAPLVNEAMPVLISAELLHEIYPACYLTEFPGLRPDRPLLREPTPLVWPVGRPTSPVGSPLYYQFQIMGHAALTLLIAAIGGGLA
jgi:hypothetical protein